MPAIAFLVVSFLCGFEITKRMKVNICGQIAAGIGSGYLMSGLITKRMKVNIWGRIAAGIGIGYLISGWIVYIVSYFSKVVLGLTHPKVYGNIASIAIMLLIAFLLIAKDKTKTSLNTTKKESAFFIVLFVFILWTMFYVFHVTTENGKELIKSGVTIFSDFAPHTAMIRSFSLHDNFPTQYPHYGGADVKYHFMFQFLAGNLEYLGLRIDWAFNWISATSLWSFLVLLYFIAKKVTGYAAAGVITVFMFFCRSSFAALDKIVNALADGRWSDFFSNSQFIGYTNHEDWGLWNYNVFLNQRHLGFGLLIAAIAIMYFIDRLEWLDDIEVSGEGRLSRLKSGCMIVGKHIVASKDAWTISPSWKTAAVVGLMLGALSFWNGAVVVATLLILFGFAVWSNHKLDYAVTAVITLILTFIQTNFFMDKSVGQSIGVTYQFGFLADELTMPGVITYLIKLAGIYFIGVVVLMLVLRPSFKAMIFSFILPVIFAFTVSMTPDIAVNHKYIIIATIFLNIFFAYAIVRLWKDWRGILTKCIAVILISLLTVTGAYDLLTIYNSDKNAVGIDLDSKLTGWLKDNIKETDLVLTGEDSMSETTFAGIMLYNGWPYYAWSAGYDTETRAHNAITIYGSDNKEEIENLVKCEGITYIVYTDGMTYEDNPCSDKVIKQLYDCVFEDGSVRVYKTV